MTRISDPLRERILAENVRVHRAEAGRYDQAHGEIFNWYEQRRTLRDLRHIVRTAPGRRALDIGSGTGNLAIKLLDLAAAVTALDLSAEMLAVLAERATVRGLSTALTVVNEPVDDFLARSSDDYDILTMSSVLHHLPDYLATLELAAGRLGPAGVLYITHEPSGLPARPRRGRGRLISLDGWFHQLRSGLGASTPPLDYSFSDYHAIHGFSSASIVGLLRERGMVVEKVEYYSARMNRGLSSAIDNLIFAVPEHFTLMARRA